MMEKKTNFVPIMMKATVQPFIQPGQSISFIHSTAKIASNAYVVKNDEECND